jgi:hypothetical protein
LPSIIPSYIYTLFASLIVGTIIIASCALVTVAVKNDAEDQQLLNISGYVAAKCLELASVPTAENLTASVAIDIPQLIGNQRYWIQIQNDSSQAWVQAGFGISSPDQRRTEIPLDVVASGLYQSGSGPVFLRYSSNNTGSFLSLYGGS